MVAAAVAWEEALASQVGDLALPPVPASVVVWAWEGLPTATTIPKW